MDGWMNNPEATKRFLSGLKPPATETTAKSPTLVLHKTTSVGDAESKKTSKCLTGNIWGYRDGDIDGWELKKLLGG
jgi:hypothetical protein